MNGPDDVAGAPARVVITDVEIPFLHLMLLIMKLMLAAVPAIFVVTMLYGLLVSIIGGMMGGPRLP